MTDLHTPLSQDYVDHVESLEDRYLRIYGEVLTFGSGDCGQLAHGIENDEDLMVKYPRVVHSLRFVHKAGAVLSCRAPSEDMLLTMFSFFFHPFNPILLITVLIECCFSNFLAETRT